VKVGKCNEMAQIIFMLIQLLLLFCCVITARRLAPLISDDNAKRSGRIAGNQIHIPCTIGIDIGKYVLE